MKLVGLEPDTFQTEGHFLVHQVTLQQAKAGQVKNFKRVKKIGTLQFRSCGHNK
jgi:hypothetical protein